MSVLYVKEQGATLQKRGDRILVTKNGNQLLDIPIFQIENLAVIGNVQITTQALHMLMEKGVDVSYFTYSGKFLGSAAAEASKNIFLRFEQYSYYLDEDKRLWMAKIITDNKIRNQMSMISHYRRKDKEYDWMADLKQMENLRLTLSDKETPNEILGVEGMCSNIYFSAFAHMLDCEFSFHGRNRRPPRDPVNVIISLAYTFLTREVSNGLDSESFEPYLGFLHGIRYGRKSLALDIVEEFRQPVVDRLVLLLFNKRMINRMDFEEEEDRVLLTESGFQKFCKEYERWMNGKNSYAGDSSFRSRIHSQIAALKRSIRENTEYKPFYWEG